MGQKCPVPFFILTTHNMAVVIFKKNPKEHKPKKEFIDLSVAHRQHKKLHNSYKKAFITSVFFNIILFLYILFIK
jgi:hypothetical protein